MSTVRKTAKELQVVLRDHGLVVEQQGNGCTVYRGDTKIAGYTMSNGSHSLDGAIRDLRKRGLLPRDERVGPEKPRRVKPADARKARARKKSPAPVTRLPSDVEGVPADRLAVKNGVRFGVYGPTRFRDALSGVRTAGGKLLGAEETARAAARLAAADRARGVPVVADTADPVVPVEDDGSNLAPEAVAAQGDGLGDSDRPVVPARTFHDLASLHAVFQEPGMSRWSA